MSQPDQTDYTAKTIVNRDGFLVEFDAKDGRRTYAVADRDALVALVERLVGQPWSSLLLDERGLPSGPVWCSDGAIRRLNIPAPLHIYSTTFEKVV